MNQLTQHTARLFEQRHHLRGLRIMRVGLGFVALMYLVSNYFDRHLLWSPIESAYPQDLVADRGLWGWLPNLYQLSPTNFSFEILFHLGMVVSFLYMIGVGGFFVKFAQYAFVSSIYQQNPLLLDGGDNLMFLILLYSLIADLSMKPLGLAQRVTGTIKPSIRLAASQGRNLVHNVGLFLILSQLAVMYLASAMYKIQGPMWQDGTALYYIMRVPEFYWPGISELIYRNGTLVVAITYATVIYQVLFLALIARRSLRPYAIAFGALFHVGIAMLMGLTSFSIVVLVIDCALLDDAHYERLAMRRAAVAKWISARRPSLPRPSPASVSTAQ